MKSLMRRISPAQQFLKRFAVLTLILSTAVLTVVCGEEPSGGEAATPAASEPGGDSSGSGTTSGGPAGGSGSK